MAIFNLSRFDKITTATFGCAVSGEEPFSVEGPFGLRIATVWKRDGALVSAEEAIQATGNAFELRTHKTFRFLDRKISAETGREYSLCQVTERTEFYVGDPSALEALRCFIREIF